MPRYLTLAPGILLDITWRCRECNESEYNTWASDIDPAICISCADPDDDN